MGTVDNRLHIKELRKKFKNYKKINVDDFNEFYSDVFGNIKRNTVSWYIYELKKDGIIRNISRGQYILGNKEIEEIEEIEEYIVITMDIIKSSELDYQEFNQKLEEKITLLNATIKRMYGLERIYNISQGDEIQILFPFYEGIGDLMMLTLSYLYPFEVRYGISVGELNSKLKKNTWEMNGPIFWNARDQLEKIKNMTNYQGLIRSGYNQTDHLCNNILPLVNKSLNKITEKQWEAIKYELSRTDLDETLEKIGISRTSYYERLSVSNLDDILSSFRAIYDLMMIRRKVN